MAGPLTEMSIKEIEGAKVLLRVNPEALKLIGVQGIDEPSFYARIVGVDQLGLWVEHPNFCSIPAYTEDGQYIPPEKRRKVCYKAYVLILWQYITSVVYFPEREGYAPAEEGAEIGFTSRLREQGGEGARFTPGDDQTGKGNPEEQG